jgi:hypothetical protein
LLVAWDELVLTDGQPSGIDEKTLRALSDAWRSILVETGKRAALKKSWRMIKQISEGVPLNLVNKSLILRRFRQSEDEDFFIILLTGDEPVGLPEYEIVRLCDLW